MFLSDINFPNQILDAIREDKLVVFAGAGASMERPTYLPNFAKLAGEIAEGTGRILKKNEPCEAFLGALKARGIDVNEQAAIILSGACLKHNALHEAIVDLFASPEKVKIVTTNYDQMFEQVLKERGLQIAVYDSPALPLGDDIKGIIHIHGNVSNPKYMVVTDEDFGKAYLTEGYATRFLVRLFESYTVLFVGYSYNDTILRYLTRAMSRQHSANRYILTDDTKSDWDALGISAIQYPKRRYAVMRSGLIKLGDRAKKGLWDWRNQFIEIADVPPKDLTIETEIDYCLETIERSRVLADSICGVEWLELLDKKGVFSCCFSESIPADEHGILWANWLCNKIVGKHDDKLKMLFIKHDNQFSDMFSKLLLNRITRDNSVNDDCYKEYITLLDRHLKDPWLIERCIEKADERHLVHLGFHLFQKLFSCSITLKKNNWIIRESIEPVHSFLGDYYLVNQAWGLIQAKVVPEYANEIISFVQKTIEDLHYQYMEMGHATDKQEPWSMSMLTIEDHINEYSKEPIHVLVQAYLQANKGISEKNVLLKGLNSESILMRKIALRTIRETDSTSCDERISLLYYNPDLIWSMECKEQVFLLAQDAFTGASIDAQNKLLSIIEEGPSDYGEERHKQYAIYNWCVWLQRTNPTNERITRIIQKVLCKYDFAPREHPELSIEESKAAWSSERSPVTQQQMLEMPIEKLIKLLLNYKGDVFDGPTRWGLMNTFSNCVKGNISWAKDIIFSMRANRIDYMEIWNCIFRSFAEADLPIDELIILLEDFTKIADTISDIQELAIYLLNVLKNKEIQTRFKEHEQMMLELSIKLWNRRSTIIPQPMQLIGKTYNTTIGIILMCWIYMFSYSDDKSMLELYKTKFEEALQLNSWEREVAICILAGHLNFFCYRDRDWCISQFEPMLTGKNEKAYTAAWEGVVYFSRRISKDTADIVAPIYLKAVKHINCLEGDVRDGFIELYLTLLIFAVEKPTLKYIPELYRNSKEEVRMQFVLAIDHRLRDLDEGTKLSLWDNWLKHFLEIRKCNKPVELTENECCSLFMLLPKLDFAFDDAIRIMCKGRLPSKIDNLFWYELKEGYLASTHSQSMVKLLISLLNSVTGIGISEDYIKQIVNSLQEIGEKDKKLLIEVLLKHNIIISLSKQESKSNLTA